MNINTIFARVTSAFNTQMDAHLRAIAEGNQAATAAPTNSGVVLYATAGTMDYTIHSYRIPGQNECILPTTERVRVKQAEIDRAATAYGYGLESKPTPGYIYTLRYLPKGAIKPAANQSPAARAATANSRQAAAMTATSNATSSIVPNAELLPPEQRIKVINVAGMTPNSPGVWYCGRKWAGWKEGVLANQHHMKSEANRGEAADKFSDDLFADIQRKGPMYWELVAMQRKLEAGETVTLGCWCAPKVCHCDTIRKAVLRLMNGQPTTPTALSAPTDTAEQPARKPNPVRAAAAAASATQSMAEPSAE